MAKTLSIPIIYLVNANYSKTSYIFLLAFDGQIFIISMTFILYSKGNL